MRIGDYCIDFTYNEWVLVSLLFLLTFYTVYILKGETDMNKMATVGMTNTTMNDISKGAMFFGTLLMVAGAGCMALSNKQFTEEEMKYLASHVTTK